MSKVIIIKLTSSSPAAGPTTASAVENEGLRLDINAPNPKAPSMTMALDDFLKDYNRNLK